MTVQPHTDTDHTPEQTLLTVQQRLNALVDPAEIADDVEARLDRLFAEGADPGVIDAIADNTADLVDQAHVLQDNLRTTLETARALRDQREQARQALENLREAMRNVDTDVPEIEELYEAIEEINVSYMWDYIYESVYDQITQNTPLNWDEAVDLVTLVTEGGLGAGVLEDDHPLWRELREWLAFVKRELGGE